MRHTPSLLHSSLTILGALALAGCSTEPTHTSPAAATTSPSYSSVDDRAKAFPINHDGWARLGYRYDWTSYPYVSGKGRIRFADAYPDMVVVQESGGILSLIETSNGGVRWSAELANPLTKFVGNERDGDRIVCSSESEAFVLAAATGNIMARQRIDKVVNTDPIIISRPNGGIAIYGAPRGEVLAHYLGQGVKVWGFRTTAAVEGRPVMMGNTIGAVAQDGSVYFIDASSGALQGRGGMFDGVSTDPVTNGQIMFVASLDQSLYAFAPTGAQLWRHRCDARLRVQPTAENDVVYCTVPELGLTAFDAGTGQIRWSAEDMGGTIIARRNGRLIAWDGRNVATLDPNNGDVIDRAEMAGVDFITTDKYDDGNLYVVAKSGIVAKFVTR